MRKVTLFVTIVMLSCGCQGSRRYTLDQSQTAESETSLAGAEPAKKKSAFSLGNIWRVVSFQGESDDSSQPLVPKEVVQLGSVIKTIANRAGQLSVDDPPEVTRKKAMGILESLKPWDSLISAGRSVGAINKRTADVLNALMDQLRAKARELVEFVPKPETIRAVKYLAGQLGLAYSNTIGLFTRAAPGGSQEATRQ